MTLNPELLMAMATIEGYIIDPENYPEAGLPTVANWLKVRAKLTELMAAKA